MTADSGAPGVFRSVALIEPPYCAPVYTAASNARLPIASIENVNGISSATAPAELIPGVAPAAIPMKLPTRMIHK